MIFPEPTLTRLLGSIEANRLVQVIVAVEDNALGEHLCRRLRSVRGDIGRHYELRVSNTGTSTIIQDREIYPMPHLVLKPAQAS